MDEGAIEFAACKFLNYNREEFVPEVTMNLISHFGETKVVWDRKNVDGRFELVQFCKKKGRLNCATACLNKTSPFAYLSYEEHLHKVLLKNIKLD